MCYWNQGTDPGTGLILPAFLASPRAGQPVPRAQDGLLQLLCSTLAERSSPLPVLLIGIVGLMEFNVGHSTHKPDVCCPMILSAWGRSCCLVQPAQVGLRVTRVANGICLEQQAVCPGLTVPARMLRASSACLSKDKFSV